MLEPRVEFATNLFRSTGHRDFSFPKDDPAPGARNDPPHFSQHGKLSPELDGSCLGLFGQIGANPILSCANEGQSLAVRRALRQSQCHPAIQS